MIIDTSAVLAVVFNERHALWLVDQLNAHVGELAMSTVSLTEALILMEDRQPQLAGQLERMLLDHGIRFVAPDALQARIAATARLRYPLNLGDCFVYALAVAENQPILTLDRDFQHTDRPVLFPPSES